MWQSEGRKELTWVGWCELVGVEGERLTFSPVSALFKMWIEWLFAFIVSKRPVFLCSGLTCVWTTELHL